jgi:hypothetical protein
LRHERGDHPFEELSRIRCAADEMKKGPRIKIVAEMEEGQLLADKA